MNEIVIDQVEMVICNLLSKKPMTRGELTEKLKMPRTSVYDKAKKMIIKGLIEKTSFTSRKQGRPKVYYYLKDSDYVNSESLEFKIEFIDESIKYNLSKIDALNVKIERLEHLNRILQKDKEEHQKKLLKNKENLNNVNE